MKKDVVSYFLVDANFIAGWQLLPMEKHPHLIDIPFPTVDMEENLIDEYGNYLYKLIDNTIEPVSPVIGAKQIAIERINRLSKKELLEVIVGGVEDKSNNVHYKRFKNLLEDSNS